MALFMLLTPNKTLHGEIRQIQLDTTITPGYHDGYVVASYVENPPLPPLAIKIAVRARIGVYNPCSCVSYAKWLSGINVGSIGVAKNHPVNTKTPVVGSLVVFRGNSKSKAGHLAVVIGIVGDKITIKESNWIHCHEGQRVIPSNEADIKGFYI